MRITVVGKDTSDYQRQHKTAMVIGLTSLGFDAIESIYGRYIKTEVVAVWGWRLGQELRDQGHEVIVMERGYLGDRFSYTSLGWNGLNGYATFPEINDKTMDRFSKFAELKPWKTNGEYILILGQVPGDKSLKGRNLNSWYEEIAEEAADAHRLPVYFRPHPLAYKKGVVFRPRNALSQDCSLEEALAKAKLAITFNSNSGVDAVINGIPAMCADEGSMAWDMCSHSVSQIVTPDRSLWAASLAWKQWSLKEIKSGEALKPLLRLYENGKTKNQHNRK